jgi:hypothetical protein
MVQEREYRSEERIKEKRGEVNRRPRETQMREDNIYHRR